MCLHKQIFFFILFPLPSRKGARGMVRPDGRRVPTRGTPTVEGVPRAPKGESEGHRPYEASAASTAGTEAPTSTTSCGIRIAVSGSFRPEPVITHTTRMPDRG